MKHISKNKHVDSENYIQRTISKTTIHDQFNEHKSSKTKESEETIKKNVNGGRNEKIKCTKVSVILGLHLNWGPLDELKGRCNK